MAFTYTLNTSVAGNLRVAYGTYTNTDASTGGTINTGLTKVQDFVSSNNTQSVTTNLMTVSGGIITLTTIADEDGTWRAEGF